MEKKYYLGLDVGTNSIGYAVTNEKYEVLGFNKKSMWGVHLFEEGKQAAGRRVHRSSRRRLQRRKQRTELIQQLFAKEVSKVDENFYLKLKESDLHREDRTLGNYNTLFEEENLNDKLYNERFPTIHHLIMHLINSNTKEDIRLIYLAVNYLVKNRGHFLFEVNKDNIRDIISFRVVFDSFIRSLEELDIEHGFNESSHNVLENVLTKTITLSKKQELIKTELFSKVKASKIENSILKAITGGKFNLYDLFDKEEYKDLEPKSLQLSKEGVEDTLELLYNDIDDFEYNLLQSLNSIYDWSVLNGILKGKEYISEGKIDMFNQHKKDLKWLKYFVKKYVPTKYNKIFRELEKGNYVSYSGNVSSLTKKEYLNFEKCDYEEFKKYIKNILKVTNVSEEDYDKYQDYLLRIEIDNAFLPKQKTKNNSSIPYQLNRYQLKKILENQSKYHTFLLKEDENGLSVMKKLLSIIEFRIPYYVGPLNNKHKEDGFAWIVRKSNKKILPWNLNEIVDLEKSEEAFIRRMTNKCTYLAGEDVLPKYSLLYSKFVVLNEINNIKINGVSITPDCKKSLYKNLFKDKYRRVTKKQVSNWLKSNGLMDENDSVTGVDDHLTSNLKSYHDFKEFIINNKLTKDQIENIIYRITLTTDKNRLKEYLSKMYKHLTNDDINKISNLKYSGFGRLSAKLINGVESYNKKLGTTTTIIEALYENNDNFMELLTDKYEYKTNIDKHNDEYYKDKPQDINGLLEDMYVPNAVKRSIFRGIAIVKDIKTIMKKDPEKIFVEMARGSDNSGRTKSRKDKLLELYKNCEKETRELWTEKLENEIENRLKSEKYFLYYSQLGRCMYSHEPISLERLTTNDYYDVDHIFPQSVTKDESIHNNKVLVMKKCNQDKGDKYPINPEVQNEMSAFWHYLEKSGLITSEKLRRLTRKTRFTDEERSGFISRQLVETRQSTKALATILTKIFPSAEIVYVKSGLVSEFRHQYELPKVRILNDYHHAKDAYLNIVIGNVYNVKFTNNPLNFVKSKERYSVNIKEKGGLLSRNIIRGDVTAWISDNNQTITNVKRQYCKNDINYVKYGYIRTKGQSGGFFDQNLSKASTNSNLKPKKASLNDRNNPYLDIQKYGGYNSSTICCFTLIKHIRNNKELISIIPIELLYFKEFIRSDISLLKYCEKQLGLKNPTIVANKKILKVNTLISFDGFRVNLESRHGDSSYYIASAMPLILSSYDEVYLKRIESVVNKAEKRGVPLIINEEHDKINSEENTNLYDVIIKKIKSVPYCKLSFFSKVNKLITDNRKIFTDLSLEDQVVTLYKLITIFNKGGSSRVDLSLIGGIKNGFSFITNGNLNKLPYNSIKIIDQSPTGLFEKSTGNLLKDEF